MDGAKRRAVDRALREVDVWRANDVTREPREEVGLLVRGERRPEDRDGLAAVLAADVIEDASSVGQRLVGGDREQPLTAAGKRAARAAGSR